MSGSIDKSAIDRLTSFARESAGGKVDVSKIPHSERGLPQPWGAFQPVNNKRVFLLVGAGLVASALLSAALGAGHTVPKTVNRQWAAATEKYREEVNADPITHHKPGKPIKRN